MAGAEYWVFDDGHAFPPTMPRAMRDQILAELRSLGVGYYRIKANGSCSQVPIVKDEPA